MKMLEIYWREKKQPYHLERNNTTLSNINAVTRDRVFARKLALRCYGRTHPYPMQKISGPTSFTVIPAFPCQVTHCLIREPISDGDSSHHQLLLSLSQIYLPVTYMGLCSALRNFIFLKTALPVLFLIYYILNSILFLSS